MSDREALKVFSRQPVSTEMVNFLVATTSLVIQVKQTSQSPCAVVPTNSLELHVRQVSLSVLLYTFIKRLVRYSNVQTPTLMATLVYLNKLRNILPANAVGIETTRHRIFLASLILSAKSLNDSSPLNKHWTKYTDGLLLLAEVNMAERELIGLLKWDVLVKEDELVVALQPFLKSIKVSLAKKVEAEASQKASLYRMSQYTHRARNASTLSVASLSSPSVYNLSGNSSRSSSGTSSPTSPLLPYRLQSSSSISSYNSTMSLAHAHPHGSAYSLRSSNLAYHLKNPNLSNLKGSLASSYSLSSTNLSTIPDEDQYVPRRSPLRVVLRKPSNVSLLGSRVLV